MEKSPEKTAKNINTGPRSVWKPRGGRTLQTIPQLRVPSFAQEKLIATLWFTASLRNNFTSANYTGQPRWLDFYKNWPEISKPQSRLLPPLHLVFSRATAATPSSPKTNTELSTWKHQTDHSQRDKQSGLPAFGGLRLDSVRKGANRVFL